MSSIIGTMQCVSKNFSKTFPSKYFTSVSDDLLIPPSFRALGGTTGARLMFRNQFEIGNSEEKNS